VTNAGTESKVRAGHLLLPVLALPDVSLFPEASLRVEVPRLPLVRVVDLAARTGGRLIALAQKDAEIATPAAHELHAVGTVAELASCAVAPKGGRTVELDGRCRGRVLGMIGIDTFVAEVEPLEEGDPGDEWGAAVEALARYLHSHAQLRTFLDQQRRSKGPMAWVNLACQHLPITASARQKLLEADAEARCVKISRGLDALLKKEKAD
jgi:Lon protease-like protein